MDFTMKALSDAEVFGQSNRPLSDEEVFGGASPQTTPAAPVAKPMTDEEVFGPSQTDLFSVEGVKSLGTAVKGTYAQMLQNTQDLLARPDEFIGALSREDNLQVRALMDQGVPFQQAHAQIRAAAEEKRRAEVEGFDAEAAMRRQAMREQQAAELPANPSEPLRHAQNITSSLSVTAPAIAAGVVTKNLPLALTIGSAPAFPLAYGESREAGSSHDRALVSAGLQTAVEAGMEILPMGGLLKDLGTDAFGRMVAKYVARETATEVPTTLIQDAIKQAVDTPDRPFSEYLDETLANAGDTLIEAPITALVGGGLAAGVNAAMPRREEPEENPIEGLKSELLAAGKDEAEVLQNVLNEVNEGSDLMGRTLNQSTSQEVELTPERIALVEAPEPLSDEEVAARVKELEAAKPLPPEELNDGTSVAGIDTALATDSQIGNTLKVRANAPNYEPNPNDAVARSARTIAFGPEGQVGQPLGKVKTKPATYVIGEPTVDRSADVLAGYHELYESLRQQFMPEATIILSNETMPTRQAVGMMQRLPSGEYLIVPAFARNFSAVEDVGTQDAASFNKHTKAKAFYNVFHEFGHALTMHRFLEGATPEVQSAFALEQRGGQISEATLAQLNPEQAELAREYNNLRAQMKTQNAAWFQATWMSPALAVQKGLINNMKGWPDMNAESFVRRLVSQGNPEIAQLRAQQAVSRDPDQRRELGKSIDDMTNALVEDYLSFDEFMAEKMARYAHETKLGQDSTLAKGEYFSGGIRYVREAEKEIGQGLNTTILKIREGLRKLFIALKKGLKLPNGQTYRITAGTTFQQWVESLGRLSQQVSPQRITTLASGELKQVQAQVKRELPLNSQSYMAVKLRKAITYGSFSVKEKQELYRLVRENALNTAHLRMVEMLKSRVKKQLDIDPEGGVRAAGALSEEERAAAIAEWGRHRERSRYFKNWFGDWENDPANASKVVTANGRPLVHFHATRGDFTQFTEGDVGFHFGDLMAAHARLYLSSPEEVQARIALDEYRGQRNAVGGNTWRDNRDTGMNIIPVYLNIRNPIEVSEIGMEYIWKHPYELAEHLYDLGILNASQFSAVVDMSKREDGIALYEKFGFLRDILKNLGYDGFKYTNAVEGGTSWVAFEPNQIKTANGVFSDSPEIHMQVDTDLATAVGLEIDTLSRTIDKYENMGLLSRALNWMSRAQYAFWQLQQLAHIHPEFYFLEMQSQAAMQYNAMKSSLQAVGEKIAKDWKGLGKEADAKLGKVLEAEAESGVHWTQLELVNGQWTHTVTAETAAKLKENGVDITTRKGQRIAGLYVQSKNALTQHMDAAQKSLIRRLGAVVQEDAEFLMRGNEIKKAFAELRNSPFLPRGDYGEWGLVVYEQKGLERTVVHRQMFESESEQIQARELLAGQKIRTVSRLPDEHRALLALPREYVDLASEALDLTQEQRDVLYDLLHPVKQDRLVTPYAKAMEKISGSSKDRMRNFADFIWHNSTLIARTEALAGFNKAEKAARDLFNEVDSAKMGERARLMLLKDIKRAQVFMQKTKDYMMAPPNEFYKVRSAIALTYLWGGVKTAFLNLYGMMITWSHITSQYGEVAGDAALLKANKQLALLLIKGKVDPEIKQLYTRAINEGFLVQNYAAHLGAAATAGLTRRLANRSRWAANSSQIFRWVADGGMLPFTLAEQYVRRITFLAMVNAAQADAKAQGVKANLETVYQEAVKQTDLLQNSYTLANRPAIMRGGWKGLITIFYSFATHLTFHSTGGYALGNKRRVEMLGAPKGKSKLGHTQRVLLMLLLFGGYEALPFAGNILDIFDAVFMSLYGKTARQSLRELIKEIPEMESPAFHWVNDPRWWSRGMGGDVAGFDISGSLGNGNPIPGTDIAGISPRTAEELAGRAVLNTTGVTGSLAERLLTMGMNAAKGLSIEQDMRRFPGFVGNVASGVEWLQSGQVKGTSGEVLYEPTSGEAFGKMAGFQPSGLNQVREENWARTEAIMYWTTQRQNLQAAWNQARDEGDREMQADVDERIREFNDSVLDPKLALREWQLHKNYRAHRDAQRKKELGIVPRNVRNLAADVSASFDEEE
jgi:hypothetical protein